MLSLLCLLLCSVSVSAQENNINLDVPKVTTPASTNKTAKAEENQKEKSIDWAFYLSILSVGISFFALFIAIANNKGMQNMKKSLRKPAPLKKAAEPKVVKPVSRAEFDDLQRKYNDLLNLLKGNNYNSAQASTTSKGNSTNQSNQNSQQANQGGQQTNLGNQQTNSNAQSSGKVKTPKVVDNGYFASPIGVGEVYFKEFITDSQNPNISFSVEKIENVATFDLLPNIDVREVLSSDYLQSVIEFDGVIKDEANSMSTKLKGQAKFNGEKWIVTRKMMVTLKK